VNNNFEQIGMKMALLSSASTSGASMSFTVSDWGILTLMAVLSLCASIVSAMEVRHIDAPSRTSGDTDLSHGQQIRRWFMYSIAAANGMRAVSTLLDGVYIHVYSLFNATPGLTSLLSFTALPSLLTFTTYSLLTVYFAQLCYTVMGMPFFHVRNSWFLVNLILYLAVLAGLFIVMNGQIVCGALASAFIADFAVVGWFGFSVFKHFPSETGSNKNASGAGGHIPHVKSRLLPLIAICMFGLALDATVYASLFYFESGVINNSIMTNSLIICAEILPSLAFLWLVSRKESQGEEASLLTATVTATGRLPILNWYSSIEGVNIENSPTGSEKALDTAYFRERL
jgi:hypothetical protein